MYRRTKFLEVLLDIRQKMAADADYDVELFAEMARSGTFTSITDPETGGKLDPSPPPPDMPAEATTLLQ